MQDIDWDEESARNSYEYCILYPEGNINVHQDNIIAKKSAKYCYYLAAKVKGVDKDRLKKVIVEFKLTSWVAMYYIKVNEDIIHMVFEIGDNNYAKRCLEQINIFNEMRLL